MGVLYLTELRWHFKYTKEPRCKKRAARSNDRPFVILFQIMNTDQSADYSLAGEEATRPQNE